MVTQACRQSGFTYLTILFIVAIMGVGLALVGEMWHTAMVRDREAELLYAGNQYRNAIARYYVAGAQQYPRALPDLLKDPRKPGTERYLRKLYVDPITGGEWGIVKAPDGGIMGVHSLSESKPRKTARFRVRDRGFEGAGSYTDWKFVYLPQSTQKSNAPAVGQPGASGRESSPAPAVVPGATNSR